MKYNTLFNTPSPLDANICRFRYRTTESCPILMDIQLSDSRILVDVDVEGSTYLGDADDNGVIIINQPSLYLVALPAPAGSVLRFSAAINEARIDRIADKRVILDTKISTVAPLRSHISGNQIIIGIDQTLYSQRLIASSRGFKTINGLEPDDNGNIDIRSVSSKINISVEKVTDDDGTN